MDRSDTFRILMLGNSFTRANGLPELLAEELSCEVLPANGEKCPRCWNWRELGEDGLCERCHDVVAQLADEE